MYLTKWEERALQGEFGEALRVAVDVLVKVCKVLRAEKLIEIAHAHVSGVSYFNIGDEGLELLEDIAKKGATVSVYTTANPASIALLPIFSPTYGKDIIAKQRKIFDLLVSIGVDSRSFTCVPYKLRKPYRGEHLAWAESSAVIYANSIAGAKTNREGGIIALMAAISGRTCFCGMHLDENRNPTEVIEVEFTIDSIAVASALGLYIGRITKGVPYIKANIRLSEKLKDIAIRSMLASIASTSSSSMAIVEGVSPDFTKAEIKALEKVTIDFNDIERFLDGFCSSSLFIGCPHIDLDEAQEVLIDLVHKRSNLRIERIYIAIPMYEADKLTSLTINISGVDVVYLPGVCPVVSDLGKLGLNFISTIHGKAYHYIPRLAGVSSCLARAV